MKTKTYTKVLSSISLVALVLLVTSSSVHADFLDNSNASDQFGSGATFSGTQWDISYVDLDAGGKTAGTGTVTSACKDATSDAVWSQLDVTTNFPTKKELPNSLGADGSYTSGALNMTTLHNVALYHMNEGSGNLTDASGLGHTATAVTTPAYSASGKLNTSIGFDGNGNYNVGVRSYFDTGTTMTGMFPSGTKTITAWVYPTVTSPTPLNSWNGAQIVADSLGNFGLLQANIGGQDKMWAYNFATGEQKIGVSFTPNTWIHLAYVYDGARVYLYKNGALVGSYASSLETGGTIYIGRGWNTSAYFGGNIDEVAFFNGALSATDIQNIYLRGATNLKFQVKTSSDALCSGTFVGSDGTAGTYVSDSATAGSPTAALSLASANLTPNRYFQYQATLQTDDATYTPKLVSVRITSQMVPKGSIAYAPASLVKAGDTLSITATFNKDLSNGSGVIPKISFSGARTLAASNMTRVDATHYTYSYVVPAGADGTVTASFSNGQDLSGNSITATPTSGATFQIDSTRPGVVLSSTATNPTNHSPIHMIATFSESVNAFDFTKIAVTGGVAGNFSTTSPTVYEFDVVPSGQTADITVNIPQNAAQDDAGNTSTAASDFTTSFDSSALTVALVTQLNNPTATSPIPVTAMFSKNVTGFLETMIVPSNATISNFRALNGSSYTFNLVPLGQGTVTADIAANLVHDAAGNNNQAAGTFTITYQTVIQVFGLGNSATSTSSTPSTKTTQSTTATKPTTTTVRPDSQGSTDEPSTTSSSSTSSTEGGNSSSGGGSYVPSVIVAPQQAVEVILNDLKNILNKTKQTLGEIINKIH